MASRSPPPLRGRGASDNPKNRFERLEIALDPDVWDDPDEEAPPTRFYKDTARTIIARNSSPDIGFETSINPYRGCEHGCSYCLEARTPILLADGMTKPIGELAVGDAVIGTEVVRGRRRFVATEVLDRWTTTKRAFRVRLRDGTELIASGDHRFLTERGWKHVTDCASCSQRPHLTPNNHLMGVGGFANLPEMNSDYRSGYLSGIVRGDGHLRSYRYQRAGRKQGNQHQFRLALADDEALDRTATFLSSFGIPSHSFLFQSATETRRAIRAIRNHARSHVEAIRHLIVPPDAPSISWSKGFLAGFFDAAGSYSGRTLRLFNTDPSLIASATAALQSFDFDVQKERNPGTNRPVQVLRVLGGLREHLRFFHTTIPAISRKRQPTVQRIRTSVDLSVVTIEPLGLDLPLVDITTGTGDFVANGVVSHNCYARPTHEFLGLSAGLDFERKILVKTEAPTLLRRELSARSWAPQPIAMSGVTDVYQPVERRLELTRRCLEVLLDFRNPATIVTKNALIERDLDLLRELAAFDGVSVALSITTLDEGLRGLLEPRTSTAANRLGAVRALADAGVHVGVLTAPIVPGLTDHEIPALLEAAKGAGARFVGYNVVHLPYGTKELFATWLRQHRPERAERVLARIRDVRGGRLNDPRFGHRMRGEGAYAEQIAQLFRAARRRAGFERSGFRLSSERFRVPGRAVQPGLFDAA